MSWLGLLPRVCRPVQAVIIGAPIGPHLSATATSLAVSRPSPRVSGLRHTQMTSAPRHRLAPSGPSNTDCMTSRATFASYAKNGRRSQIQKHPLSGGGLRGKVTCRRLSKSVTAGQLASTIPPFTPASALFAPRWKTLRPWSDVGVQRKPAFTDTFHWSVDSERGEQVHSMTKGAAVY